MLLLDAAMPNSVLPGHVTPAQILAAVGIAVVLAVTAAVVLRRRKQKKTKTQNGTEDQECEKS